MKKMMVATIFTVSLLTGALTFNFLSPLLAKKVIHVDGAIPLKDKTRLIGDADIIVHGKVKDILPSKWSNPDGSRGKDVRNILQTDIILSIDKVYKGVVAKKDSVVIRIDSGETDKIKVVSEGYPTFEKNEEIVAFLSSDDSDVAVPNEDYYVLTGMQQGKFELKDKDLQVPDTKKIFTNHKEEIDALTLSGEIPKELEKYNKLPKMKDAKLYQP